MSFRPRPLATALLVASLCASLGACASRPAEPMAAAAAAPAKAAPPPHARPKSDCQVARVNLPPQRKEALFEQFASEEGAAVPAAPAPAHPLPPGCRVAAR